MEQFVPAERHAETVPCRFIELTEQGESVEDFYRTGTQVEMEAALASWLRAQINKIEQERGVSHEEGVA